MDSKRHSGKQYASNVSFAPQQPLPKRLDSHSMDIQPLIVQSGKIRQDSLSGSVCNFNMKAAGRQGSITSPVAGQAKSQLQYQAFLDLNHAAVKCLFRARWRILSYLQITFGLLAVALSIYSHYPIFTCGLALEASVDFLWFGCWTGVFNLLCGLCGLAASKSGFYDNWHRILRRTYFILNCSFLPFANGTGMTSFGITLTVYQLICNPSPVERFTTIMAFIQLAILTVCMILNILGIIYQIVATIKCKCWICSPKNPPAISG